MAGQTNPPKSVRETIDLFLADMEKEQFSLHTLRDYSIDLKRFANFYQGPLEEISGNTVSEFFGSFSHLRPSSLARKRAAISSFLRWAYHRQFITHNPMTNIDDLYPRAESHPLPNLETVSKIFRVIPPTNLRDRIMFRIIGELGLSAMEMLTFQVEDIDLAAHPLHLVQRRKTALNQASIQVTPSLDSEIRQYLSQSSYHQGPLFRAQRKKREEPLRFQSLYEIWTSYCRAAGISLSLHDLQLLALSIQKDLGKLKMSGGTPEKELLELYQYFYDKDIQYQPQTQAGAIHQEPHSRQLVPVYLDIETIATGTSSVEGYPWRYTQLEFGYCAYPAYAQCPHRLACPHCGFFRPPEDIHMQPGHIQRLFQELELSEAEQNVLEKKPEAEQHLREQLMDVPTPAGPTPRQLRGFASSSGHSLQKKK